MKAWLGRYWVDLQQRQEWHFCLCGPLVHIGPWSMGIIISSVLLQWVMFHDLNWWTGSMRPISAWYHSNIGNDSQQVILLILALLSSFVTNAFCSLNDWEYLADVRSGAWQVKHKHFSDVKRFEMICCKADEVGLMKAYCDYCIHCQQARLCLWVSKWAGGTQEMIEWSVFRLIHPCLQQFGEPQEQRV